MYQRALYISLAITVVSLNAMAASAGLISRDFRAPGDGLLTFDTVNRREWLDLSEASGLSWRELYSAFGPAGKFNGFHWASVDDIIGFVLAGGFTPATIPGHQDFDVARNLISLVSGRETVGTYGAWFADGIEVSSSGSWQTTRVSVRAWSVSEDDALAHPALRGRRGASMEVQGFSARANPPLTLDEPAGSVWLFREVPEPSTALLSVAALLVPYCLMRTRLRKETR